LRHWALGLSVEAVEVEGWAMQGLDVSGMGLLVEAVKGQELH